MGQQQKQQMLIVDHRMVFTMTGDPLEYYVDNLGRNPKLLVISEQGEIYSQVEVQEAVEIAETTKMLYQLGVENPLEKAKIKSSSGKLFI